MKISLKKIVILCALVIAFISLFYYFRLNEYFELKQLQEHNKILSSFVQRHYFFSVLVYISLFTMALACALPVVMPFALLGGFLYGIFFGVIYAGISCLLGSIISFLALRYVFGSFVKDWHSAQVDKFLARIQKYGPGYLLVLHFLSVIPLFLINLVAAMANIPFKTVLWVTIVGTFPLNFLCALAGRQLSLMRSYKDIFSPTIITLLAILALISLAPFFIEKIKGLFRVQ